MCLRLSEAFYARLDRDPLLRPLFPGSTLHCAIAELAAFLAQFLGGPSEDAERRWWLSLRESHMRFKVGRKERDAWMGHMVKALGDVDLAEPARNAFRAFFEHGSAYVVNAGPCPLAESKLDKDIERRWKGQQALDRAVAAVRKGNAARAIELTNALENRSVIAGLFSLMIRSGDVALIGYVRTRLLADPALVHERCSGRTILHNAAAAGSMPMVELLVRLGADCNGPGHPPLYCAANECAIGGGDVVRALVAAGANVDSRENVKRCTALHLAARRGNVEIAEALLDCGADIEARDSAGDTPLRRAVNCGKTAVAALLLSRGADRESVGNKGLTPRSAARTAAMKQILER